jgi:hypothetical protein
VNRVCDIDHNNTYSSSLVASGPNPSISSMVLGPHSSDAQGAVGSNPLKCASLLVSDRTILEYADDRFRSRRIMSSSVQFNIEGMRSDPLYCKCSSLLLRYAALIVAAHSFIRLRPRGGYGEVAVSAQDRST